MYSLLHSHMYSRTHSLTHPLTSSPLFRTFPCPIGLCRSLPSRPLTHTFRSAKPSQTPSHRSTHRDCRNRQGSDSVIRLVSWCRRFASLHVPYLLQPSNTQDEKMEEDKTTRTSNESVDELLASYLSSLYTIAAHPSLRKFPISSQTPSLRDVSKIQMCKQNFRPI